MTARVRPTVSPVCPTGIDLRLVEAMTKTNTAVKNTSASMTAPSLNPPGEWTPYPLEANPAETSKPGFPLAIRNNTPPAAMPPST